MEPERKILRVAQLNSATRTILEANFPYVWVAGELSNLVEPSSGHLYFSLKDERAQVRAVLFRGRKSFLKFQPQNGAQVVVGAQVTLYEPRGDYQLLVDVMEPAGAGALHAKFLQLKEKLAAEQLFAAHHKRQLPKLPRTIGIITSPTGAALRDILTILKRRFAGVEIIIYPTVVQGGEAAAQIVAALQLANQRNECELLILARGGGSLEDLWPFNEEQVARAIFASKIPLISAVGHETDFTIADFVADLRAPTPSAAAELAVPDLMEWYTTIVEYKRRLLQAIGYKLQHATLLVTNLLRHLRHPRYYLVEQAQRLDEMERRLYGGIKQQLLAWQQRLEKYSGALDLVSPLATLTRGYAMVKKEGRVVTCSALLKREDEIEVRLADGRVECSVTKVEPDSS